MVSSQDAGLIAGNRYIKNYIWVYSIINTKSQLPTPVLNAKGQVLDAPFPTPALPA